MSEIAAPDNELLADIEEAMRDVVDPELGINVVDLGLVYGVNLEEAEEGTVALIDMTLTSPACPLTDVIEDWSTSCGSTGCGIRRGARTRSPTTAATNYALWASLSEL
jgi:metal-sulfur cluster biosynthetic enzyme